MFATGVGWGSGEPLDVIVLIDGQASPSKPSPVPWENCSAKVLASSTDWFWIFRPPTETTSVPTSPDAELPSPYSIFHS